MARPWPLRTRLVAAVLALVAAALIAIGFISYIALRQYLIERIDAQLVSFTRGSTVLAALTNTGSNVPAPPTNWIITRKSDTGVGTVFPNIPEATQPRWPTSFAAVAALPTTPYSTRADDGTDWRLLAIRQPNGEVVFVGQSLTEVEGATQRLIFIELIVGGATLVIITAIGAGLIRASLRPLAEIESTAAAITAGDLTRRVPEYEPDASVPGTEVGTLGRTLNTMLTEIEVAFQARAESESRARAAADSARAAAEAAHRSETRARRSEERMREFAADASHELRTPLTTIRGFAELYRQGAAREPEETARLMRRIEDEAERMGLLVDDLLLLARLDQERPLERLPVDLRVVAADAVAGAEVVAPDRPVSMEIVPGAGPLIVTGDELRIRQVVSNLMTNALAYTPPESPIALRLSSDGAGYAELDVIDSGPGLDAEQMDRAFERFYRGEAGRTRRSDTGHSSGTGLGLAIVAALVRAHGGTVDVTSTPGHGATFRVRLPLERRDDAVSADDDAPGQDPNDREGRGPGDGGAADRGAANEVAADGARDGRVPAGSDTAHEPSDGAAADHDAYQDEPPSHPWNRAGAMRNRILRGNG